MLYGIGLTDADLAKPQVGICSMWYEGNTCNMHLDRLAAAVREATCRAGLVGLRFNTIGVSDGLSMGTEGMSYSLPSRDLIADSVEYMVEAHCADALICISNCDKITPGMLMAALRLNIPAVFVSGGPMEAGKVTLKGKEVALDLVDAMVAAADETMTDTEVATIERSACPTCGSCSGMFTANSMNCLTEALGLSLPGNGTVVATHADRKELFLKAGRTVVDMCRRYYEHEDLSVLPRAIATKAAFENAMALDVAMGFLPGLAAPVRRRAQISTSALRGSSVAAPLTCSLQAHTRPTSKS